MTRLANRKDLLEVVGGPRDDVHAYQLAYSPRRGSARIRRGFDRPHVAADDHRDKSGIDFLPPYNDDVRRFHHNISRFNHPDKTARLDHAKGVAHVALRFLCHGVTVSRAAAPTYPPFV